MIAECFPTEIRLSLAETQGGQTDYGSESCKI